MAGKFDGASFPLSFDFKCSKVRAKAALDKEFRKARIYIVSCYEKSVDDGAEEFTIDLTNYGMRVRRQMLREVLAKFPTVTHTSIVGDTPVSTTNIHVAGTLYYKFKIRLTDE